MVSIAWTKSLFGIKSNVLRRFAILKVFNFSFSFFITTNNNNNNNNKNKTTTNNNNNKTNKTKQKMGRKVLQHVVIFQLENFTDSQMEEAVKQTQVMVETIPGIISASFAKNSLSLYDTYKPHTKGFFFFLLLFIYNHIYNLYLFYINLSSWLRQSLA